MRIAFHPQMNWETERINAILEQYLTAYVNYQQDNWTELLPIAEFAYNNSRQETIQNTPFYANYGYQPVYEAIGHMIPEEKGDMSQLHDILRENMMVAQLCHKENYNKHRQPDPNLRSGDHVWLNTKNIQTTRPSRKLDYKKVGPFRILGKVGRNSYKLNLPPDMRTHPTFHISLLEPYSNNPLCFQCEDPPPPIGTVLSGPTPVVLLASSPPRPFRFSTPLAVGFISFSAQRSCLTSIVVFTFLC